MAVHTVDLLRRRPRRPNWAAAPRKEQSAGDAALRTTIQSLVAANSPDLPNIVAVGEDLISGDGVERLAWSFEILRNGSTATPRPDSMTPRHYWTSQVRGADPDPESPRPPHGCRRCPVTRLSPRLHREPSRADPSCAIAPSLALGQPDDDDLRPLFQGAFGALLIPQGIAIMTKNFTREMRAKAFGAFGPMLGIAGIGGPVLAGFIINADIAGLSWRPMFLINIVLGGIGLGTAIRVLPHDDGDQTAHVDAAGSTLLGAAMFGLRYGLIEGSTNGWVVVPLTSIASGLVAFALFACRQGAANDPLLKASLLKNKGFISGLVMGLAFFPAINGTAYVLSLFLQQGLGHYAGRPRSPSWP